MYSYYSMCKQYWLQCKKTKNSKRPENARMITTVLHRKEDFSEQLECKIWLLFNENNEPIF